MTGRIKKEHYGTIYERFLYSDLSDKAVRLMLVLDRHADKDIAYPGRPRLAGLVGCSVDTIDRLVKELVGAGAVTLVHAPRPGGGRPMTTYYLWPTMPSDDADDEVENDVSKAAPTRLCGRTDAASKPQTEGSSPYIEPEPFNERPSAGDNAPGDLVLGEANEICRQVWETRRPKPAANYLGVRSNVVKVLRAGWTREQVYAALMVAKSFTLGAIEFQLNTPPLGSRQSGQHRSEAEAAAYPEALRILHEKNGSL